MVLPASVLRTELQPVIRLLYPGKKFFPLNPAGLPEDSPDYDKTRLNPEFTFDTLVTGRSNDLARAAAQQVAINPGSSYNPLFIYGGVGLGKTHLVHALGNEVLRHAPDKVIRYIHAEDYYSDVVRAFQQKSFDIFKRTYRTMDVLLVDDIQFFNGKARTQEEFFYVFNALVEAKKQIVITCDTYPKDIQGLEERLISRFDWGLTVQIEPPELEMRVAILKKKADSEAIALGDDVAFLDRQTLALKCTRTRRCAQESAGVFPIPQSPHYARTGQGSTERHHRRA